MKKWQFCAEEIQSEAIKCKHCGEFLAQGRSNQTEKGVPPPLPGSKLTDPPPLPRVEKPSPPRPSERLGDILSRYSEVFGSAVAALDCGDIDQAWNLFCECITNAERNAKANGRFSKEIGFDSQGSEMENLLLYVGREWTDAYCGLIYCNCRSGEYEEALKRSESIQGWSLGFNLPQREEGYLLRFDARGPTSWGWCHLLEAAIYSCDKLKRIDDAVSWTKLARTVAKTGETPDELHRYLRLSAFFLVKRAIGRLGQRGRAEECLQDLSDSIKVTCDSLAQNAAADWHEDWNTILESQRKLLQFFKARVQDLKCIEPDTNAGKIILELLG